jgi:serine protease inhibitor
MRNSLLTSLACVCLVTVTACGGAAEVNGEAAAHLEAQDVQMADPTTDLSYDEIADGNRSLGYDLATSIPTDDGNVVFSPASLAVAFAMLREGAAAGTAEEIDRVLHLPDSRSMLYNGLLHQVSDVGAGDVLELNDGLFVDPSLAVERSYLEALKRWYGAGVEQTEFPAPALDQINGWVDDKTHGRIPQLLDQLDPQAVFALVNTIYLNAKWQQPFDADDTNESAFTTALGAGVVVDMMHASTTYDYAETSTWQAVRLPYQGGELSMVVLLARDETDPVELLSADVLAAADRGFAAQEVDLALPKWDLETTAELTGILRSLGMDDTFGGRGDFSALTPDPSFAVTEVLQQANITVGEEGTEAAAATAIVGEALAAAPPEGAVDFVADHPFAFAIMHDPTGVPLFEGVVADPS